MRCHWFASTRVSKLRFDRRKVETSDLLHIEQNPYSVPCRGFSFNVPQHSKKKDDPSMQWSNGLAVLFEATKSNEHYRVRGFGYAVIGGKAS
jgi:hypothetical protein